MKHTQGPWYVAKEGETMESDGVVVESPNGYEVRPDGYQRLGDEMADLTLIAAAPDLLDACISTVEVLSDFERLLQSRNAGYSSMSALRKVKAAIAKAKGEQ